MSTPPSEPAPRAPARQLLQLSLPVAMGYVPLGMVFGFLLVQAGAAQFMAVPMLAAGVPLAPIAGATLVINLRHVFYGLSLLQRLPRRWWARAYLVWALTDENYSVISALPESTPTGQVLGVAALNHFWWVLGSLVGAVAGAQVRVAWDGIDFALAALFAVLAIEQWRAARTLLPAMVAAVAYLSAVLVAPSQALVVAIALTVVAGLVLGARQRRHRAGEGA